MKDKQKTIIISVLLLLALIIFVITLLNKSDNEDDDNPSSDAKSSSDVISKEKEKVETNDTKVLTPTIEVDPKEVYILVGMEYDLLTGVKVANGTVECDLKSTKNLEIGDYTVTYTVKNGNKSATAIRVVFVMLPLEDADGDGFTNEEEILKGSNPFDNLSKPLLNKPSITLIGAANIELERFASYNDSGAKAKDSLGNNISVATICNVNTQVTGEYTCVYIAVDRVGNAATAIRTIIVKDTTSPILNGVTNNEEYKYSVSGLTITSDDNDISNVVLTKNGIEILGYVLGDTITEIGDYVLVVTDDNENTTTISFKIVKANAKFEFVPPTDLIFDGNAKEFYVNVYDLEDNLIETITSVVYSDSTGATISAPINVGKYRVSAYFAGNDYYEETTETNDFEITYTNYDAENADQFNALLAAIFTSDDAAQITLTGTTYDYLAGGFNVPAGKTLVIVGNNATILLEATSITVDGNLIIKDATINAKNAANVSAIKIDSSNAKLTLDNVVINQEVMGAKGIIVADNATNVTIALNNVVINLVGGETTGIEYTNNNNSAKLSLNNVRIINFETSNYLDDTKGIYFNNQSDVEAEIIDSTIEGFKQVINIDSNASDVTLNIDKTILEGMNALVINGNDNVVDIEDSYLSGTNYQDGDGNDSAVIIIDPNSLGNVVTIKDSEIEAIQEGDQEQETIDNQNDIDNLITMEDVTETKTINYEP